MFGHENIGYGSIFSLKCGYGNNKTGIRNTEQSKQKIECSITLWEKKPNLVVGVGEELDDEGEEVGGHHVVQVLRHLLAVHRYVRHLLHQLGSHARL